MTSVVMLEAALFALRAASGDIDPESAPQLGLCIDVLARAIAAGRDCVNAAIVNDIDFAANDLVTLIDELPQSDVDRLAPFLAVLREDLAVLKSATALDAELIARIRRLQSKLHERMKAIERQTYVEGGAMPLPHPPESLREEAIRLASQLAEAGFPTPALDALIATPETLRFHSIRDLFDELDVIAG